MDGRPTWTDCYEAGDYVVPNVLSPRDLVFRPDNMDETVPHTAANYAVCGRILQNFELVRDIMVVLHTCKNEEDPIKNEDARVLTRLLFNFSDTQRQLTPKSVVEFRGNSNSSQLL